MELRQLRYFLAVAQELHFGRAAERAHIAQSPLSRQIKLLEDSLGVVLFQRTKHKVELTDAGRALILEAQAILAATEQAKRSVLRAEEGLVGRLVIGYTNTAIYSNFSKILMAYRHQFPKVELVLQDSMLTPMQIDAMVDKHMDIGCLRPPVQSPDIELLTIANERLVLALPATHPLASLARINMKDLAQEGFICFSRSLTSSLQTLIFQTCHDAGFQARVVQEVGDIPTMLMLVSCGMGVALVPSSSRSIRMNGLVLRNLVGGGPQLELALGWNRGVKSVIRNGFIDVARSFVQRGG
ncbi:LysR family transcriptional regulator [Acidovorax sp. JHL-3]|uniref:LysR family transcriptional regulator n=1 Tax=Acidovorax sp. JHL-3 TaxID=1276755 RepID=UPI000464EC71|nr:LysR family transcriptional regulator [Acidovorax sp. JHL-3]